MKRIVTLCIMLISIQTSFAQESKLSLSLGAGMANTSSANKNNLIGNGFNLQAEAFMPIYSRGNNFKLGVNVSGNYAGIKNISPNNADVAGQYQVYGGNIAVASSSEGTRSSSFSGLAGIQASISFGKFNVSPSLNSGYLNLNQKGYVQNGTATINGQSQQKELMRSDNQTSEGFIFKPQMKIGYAIAQNFSLFISPSIAMGPEMTYHTQYLVPQGGFNDKKTYEASQLAKGTWETKTTTSRYNVTEINFGVTVALGKKKPVKNATGLGSGPGAASSSYARTTSTSNSDDKTKPQDSATVNNRLSMTPTTAKQTQGKTFGEAVAGGIQANTTPTNPLYDQKGSEGTNPLQEKTVVTTPKQTQGKNFGEKMANGLQTGEKGITQIEPSQAAEGGVRTYTGGRKNERLSMTPTTTKQTQGKNFGEKVANGLQENTEPTDEAAARKSISTKGVKRSESSEAAKPGQPIKGVIVKGGTNPGGNKRLISNAKGEVILDNLQKGNYLFQLEGIAPAGKSISTKGVKRSESSEAARPGQPIKGVIVKGGKNPGGNYINLTVNANGQVGFEVLEAGNYKLLLETPSTKNPKPESKSKPKEKATSGLKDTLKTNV